MYFLSQKKQTYNTPDFLTFLSIHNKFIWNKHNTFALPAEPKQYISTTETKLIADSMKTEAVTEQGMPTCISMQESLETIDLSLCLSAFLSKDSKAKSSPNDYFYL